MERIISSQENLRKFEKYGTVIFIFNTKGELLTCRENSSRELTGKVKGELSVICETAESGEALEETTLRGIKEELGLDENGISNLLWLEPNTSYLGETIFIPGVLAGVVKFYCNDDHALLHEINNGRGDGEVSDICWMPIDDLLENTNLRLGVRNVIQTSGDALDFRDFNTWLNSLTINNLRFAMEDVPNV